MAANRPSPKFGWHPEEEVEKASTELELFDISADTEEPDAPESDKTTLLEGLDVFADEDEKLAEAYERLEKAIDHSLLQLQAETSPLQAHAEATLGFASSSV